jgi:predicted Zn-dependent protease
MKTFFCAALLFAAAPAGSVQTRSAPAAISDAGEISAGEVLAAKFVKANGLASTPQTIKIDRYLQSVGERVAAHAPRSLPYRFQFDPDPGFQSAVALPGGPIFVGGGILAYTDTEDELAVVLGHEIEHVALGHCRERLVQELAGKHLSTSDFEGLDLDPFMASYGHEREFAADREGVKLAMEAGYSANAAVRLLRTFVVLAQHMPNTPREAASNLEARIAQIQPLVESQKPALTEKPLALPH